MSFTVSFARREFGFLPSDTRTQHTDWPGPDAPVVGFSDDGEKIFPMPRGWFNSGPYAAWHEMLRDAYLVGDTDRPARAMAELERGRPALAAHLREQQTVIEIGTDGAECLRRIVDWAGGDRFPFPHREIAAPQPVGADPAVVQPLLGAYQSAIDVAQCLAEVVRSDPLPAILRATAQLYSAVYQHLGPEGSVSPLMEMGIVWRAGRRVRVGPFPSETMLAASDEDLAALVWERVLQPA